MQCTSYIPVYYHARDHNVGPSGYSWHLFNSNTNYGEQDGYNISLPTYNVDQCSNYDKDKEALKQIIQNHDATFRCQVQELHRLYRRQRELMDDMRARKMFARNLLSQTSESIHSLSHVRSDISQATTSHAASWLFGDHSHSKLSELAAENIQRPPSFITENFQEHSTVFTGPFIRKNSYNEVKFMSSRNKLNENRILDLEYPADVYHDDKEQHYDEINKTDSEIGSIKTGDLSGLNLNSSKSHCLIDLNEPIQLVCDGQSDRRNSSMAIDLNCMPDCCFSDTENSVEDQIDIKFLKTKIDIDLNIDGVLNEPCLPLSSSTAQIKSGGGAYLEGPVSPENEECSPPRCKSENTQLEKPHHLLEQENMEIDIIAAQTIVTISSINRLSWLAEIVCATGDDLEKEVMKLDDNAADYTTIENALNVSCVVKKEKEMHSSSMRSRTRRCKDSQTEAVPFQSNEVRKSQGFSSRRNASKKGCVKPRKCSDRVKKSMSSILKQPVNRSKQGILQSWGKIKKREGGLRRRATKFTLIS